MIDVVEFLKYLFCRRCKDWRRLKDLQRCRVRNFEQWQGVLFDPAHPWTRLLTYPSDSGPITKYRVCMKRGNVDSQFIYGLKLGGVEWTFPRSETRCRHSRLTDYASAEYAIQEAGRMYLLVGRQKCWECPVEYNPENAKCPRCGASKNSAPVDSRKSHIIAGGFVMGTAV